MRIPIFWTAFGILALTVGGCASQSTPAKPPMTQAQAIQKLQAYAQDPNAPQMAKAAAQHGLAQSQAQQMLEEGH